MTPPRYASIGIRLIHPARPGSKHLHTRQAPGASRPCREEALIVGPSTGAVVAGMGQLPIPAGDLVVGISADSGIKYTSYLAELLGDEGLPRI